MEKYFLGLDIGTSSCGWAVTDSNYNLVRKKGKDLWGSVLIEQGQTASETRLKRTGKRRLNRKKLQLMWLREIFEAEITKTDPYFFDRLKYSSLWQEDKLLKNEKLDSKYSLFNGKVEGKEYTDKDYFNDYKTIYHLRNELLTSPAKDVRLLYLAIHNIIKHRGHFLYEGDLSNNGNVLDNINRTWEIFSLIESLEPNEINFKNITNETAEEIVDALKNNLGIRNTKLQFNSLFNAKTKKEKAVVSCFVDGKLNLKELFNIEKKLDFNSDKYLEDLEEVRSELDENEIASIEQLNKVYSILSLKKILGNCDYICESRVKAYEKHESQLKILKNFIRTYHPSKYFEMFRYYQKNKNAPIISNYALYVNGDMVRNKKRVVMLDSKAEYRTIESFYKYIKGVLALPVEIENYDKNGYEEKLSYILTSIENNDFLVKQRIKANSVFPNKLYEKELKKILEVNKERFLFLKERDEYGSNEDKIINILNFRVPYFVGPIRKEENSGRVFGWAERNSNLEYKPWTLNKIVDFDKAEDDFILKMLNKCTYLKNYYVLPKHSILYSKYRVLNELNNLKFNGDGVPVEIKQKIFNELFCEHKKVSIKLLKDFLIREGYDAEIVKELQIGGIDKTFANDMSVYSFLLNSNNFTKEFLDNNIDKIERVITLITLIEDKRRLEERIKKEFGETFNNAQIKTFKGLNCVGWGRLSKEFLQGLFFINKITGERTTIIDEMWNTNKNLQEIIFSSDYTLQEELAKKEEKVKDEITYENIQEMYCSPAVKKAVWNAIKVVKEIISIMGSVPDKIFVEVTRHDEEKGEVGRKLARKNNLLSIYNSKDFKNSVKNICSDLEELYKELIGKDNLELRSEKLYLYFLQLGRCAYSGEKINIDDLYNDNLYDIDHIFPQSLIKDDSPNNKVLVKNEYNKKKDNNYPIYSAFPEWYIKQKNFWSLLLKLGLMSEKKFSRLMRTTPLTEEELGGFIERQIVETNQSASAVIDLLKHMANKPNDVIYSKAKFVTDFRNIVDIPKSRIVNDYHHAKDAYLNVVVGSILFNRFTGNPRYYYKNNDKNNNETKTINVKKIFNHTIFSPVTNNVIWNGEVDKNRVKEICEKNSCIVNRVSYKKLNGAFYDETLYKKSRDGLTARKGDVNNPLGDVSKYGGFTGVRNGYFVVVESEKKDKKIKTIESVPVLILMKYKNDSDKEQRIAEYIAKENNLKNVKILKIINFASTFKIGSGYFWLGGKTGERFSLSNANEWNVSYETTKYIRALEKYSEIKKNNKNNLENVLKEENNRVIISKKTKERNKEIALTKDENITLYNLIIAQLSKDIYLGVSGFSNLKVKLIENKNKFENFKVLEQADVLLDVLKGLSTGATSADLSKFGAGKSVGDILIGKNITDKEIYLVENSVTGLLNKVTRL